MHLILKDFFGPRKCTLTSKATERSRQQECKRGYKQSGTDCAQGITPSCPFDNWSDQDLKNRIWPEKNPPQTLLFLHWEWKIMDHIIDEECRVRSGVLTMSLYPQRGPWQKSFGNHGSRLWCTLKLIGCTLYCHMFYYMSTLCLLHLHSF